MAVNPLDGLGAYLKANGAVTTRVGTRVYWPKLPPSQNAVMPIPTIVLRPSGGYGIYGHGTLQIGDSRIDTDCFGATGAESWQVHLVVRAALKNLAPNTTAGVRLLSCYVSAGGMTAEDPDTKWPLTIASYTLVASEVLVP